MNANAGRSAPIGGTRIEIIAPSGAHLSLESFDAALHALRARGYEVHCSAPREGWQRFADTDAARLDQIHRAARMRDIDAVMITRGGYGISRLLDRIDWSLVGESALGGVRWIGYSDFTAFQLALLARTGAPSFAGPGASGDFGVAEPDPYMLGHFDAVMAGRLLPVQWSEKWPQAGQRAIAPVEGVLWGGNLSLVAAAVGTEWLPAIRGGILFLEDVAEHPYRVERMLHQLLYAGILENQGAIVLGEFTEWRSSPHDNGYDLGSVVDYLRQRIATPVFTGLPFGHVPRKAVLGVGAHYLLETSGATRRLVPLVPGSQAIDPTGIDCSASRTNSAAPSASTSSLKS